MLVSHADPIFPADPPSFSSIEELRHHRTFGEGAFVFIKGFHVDKTRATVSNRVIVVIVMRLLDDDFVL